MQEQFSLGIPGEKWLGLVYAVRTPTIMANVFTHPNDTYHLYFYKEPGWVNSAKPVVCEGLLQLRCAILDKIKVTPKGNP